MSKRKKVLFTSHTANFAKFNRPLMRDLRAQGYEVDYASANEEKVLDTDRAIQIDFARSPLKLWQHWRAYCQLLGLFEKEQYDLIHCHTPVGGILTRLAAKKIEKRHPEREHTPMIYTTHGFHFYRGSSLINWLLFYPVERWAARSTDCLITINTEDYQLAKRKMKAKRVEQIPGVGADLERFAPISAKQKRALRKAQGFGQDDFILIYVAELNRNKSQEFLIQSAPVLKQIIPHLQILLVGTGAKEKTLQAKVQKMGLDETIKFLGYRRDVEKLYQLSDIVISVSRREGLGMSLIEGMACGLPAIARDNRGHREVIATEQSGFLFKTANEFREAVVKLYQNPKLRAEIGRYNVKVVRKFAVEKTLAKMRAIYQDYL